VSALAAVAAAADPALRGHVVAEPAGARYEHLGPDRAFVLEAVREGYELHYGEPRVFAGMDSDLALLAGDALYALGLSRLAELGDLPAVAELADLISLCAQAQAAQWPCLRATVRGRAQRSASAWRAAPDFRMNSGFATFVLIGAVECRAETFPLHDRP
jgi:hypothetical protein